MSEQETVKIAGLERKKYYIPIYCSRRFPSWSDIYDYIISGIAIYKYINVYEDKDRALKEAESWLCDDDCADVATLDFTDCSCIATYEDAGTNSSIKISSLHYGLKVYKIIKD